MGKKNKKQNAQKNSAEVSVTRKWINVLQEPKESPRDVDNTVAETTLATEESHVEPEVKKVEEQKQEDKSTKNVENAEPAQKEAEKINLGINPAGGEESSGFEVLDKS